MDQYIRNLYIIGFPKCGSTSLRSYLRKRYPTKNVASFPAESLYHRDWTALNLRQCLDPITLPIIIIRDPYQRIWSAYWWATKYVKKLPTFEYYLIHGLDHHSAETSGLSNPVKACDYWHYIKKAESCSPLILRFEDMIKLSSFPHEAKTEDVVATATGIKIIKPKLDDENRKLIKEAFIREGIDDKY